MTLTANITTTLDRYQLFCFEQLKTSLPSIFKYNSCQYNAIVIRTISPDYSHDASDGPDHAEIENSIRQMEFMAPLAIVLMNRKMCDCAN